MTKIVKVTQKEMTRRTGVKNALGYSLPDEDTILLRKGLRGKLKRNVLSHEMDHIEKGEEGPFGASSALGVGASIADWVGANQARDTTGWYADATQKLNEPYVDFGTTQLGDLKNWLSGPTGAFSPITSEDVQNSTYYQNMLNSMQNTSAAKGGLMSGNFLRSVGTELVPQTTDYLKNQRYKELAQRLGLITGVGMPMTTRQQQGYQFWGPQEAGAQEHSWNRFGDVFSSLGSAIGGGGGGMGGGGGGGG